MNAAVKQGTAATAVFGKPDERELRDRMKQELPADTFKAQTWRVIWFLPLQAVIWAGLAVILMAGLPWYANLGLGLLVGHTIGCQALLAHEVLHGALGMSRGKAQHGLAYLLYLKGILEAHGNSATKRLTGG